ncbi:MAG: class I SAM-dependent methyltransferase [Halieaceae bacterium]|nr:class I SAM-dependent methyltransferase [Halieaceae bacterium]
MAASTEDELRAQQLAETLGLEQFATASNPAHCESSDVLLVVRSRGIYLQQTGKGAPGPVTVEFGSVSMRHRRRGGHNELLGRAVGVTKKPGLRVLDATAGLGRDSFVLADIDCRVTLCEREPLIVEMLAAGMDIASAAGDSWLMQVIGRMELFPGDARTVPGSVLSKVDVIYLDPMFPNRDKKARVKKEMALFHTLLDASGSQDDADDLLRWALRQTVSRVVVKRSIRAPPLADRAPSHTIAGKAVRYDVYVLRGLNLI